MNSTDQMQQKITNTSRWH